MTLVFLIGCLKEGGNFLFFVFSVDNLGKNISKSQQ